MHHRLILTNQNIKKEIKQSYATLTPERISMQIWTFQFYDPRKSVLQILQMLKNACECHCESCECVSNEIRTQNMGN